MGCLGTFQSSSIIVAKKGEDCMQAVLPLCCQIERGAGWDFSVSSVFLLGTSAISQLFQQIRELRQVPDDVIRPDVRLGRLSRRIKPAGANPRISAAPDIGSQTVSHHQGRIP